MPNKILSYFVVVQYALYELKSTSQHKNSQTYEKPKNAFFPNFSYTFQYFEMILFEWDI